jgi:DNA (cytosine-5)-methyltransferase 1
MKKHKAIELFAGTGWFKLACDNLGIETVFANDMEPNAVKVYRDNFRGNSIIQGDINKLIEWKK